MCPELRWIVCSTQPQVLVHTIRINHLAGIHPLVGVPDGLELAKGLNKLGAIHFREQLGTRLTIAMLSRN